MGQVAIPNEDRSRNVMAVNRLRCPVPFWVHYGRWVYERTPWSGPGLALTRAYWADVVGPLLSLHCPEVLRAAARVGPGSEVLGLDDVISGDHDWGLRLQIFVSGNAVSRVHGVLASHLPEQYKGLPTRLTLTGQTEPTMGVEVLTVSEFAHDRLGFDPRRSSSVEDWLSVSGQAALEVTAGSVFEDQEGSLTELRHAVSAFPEDLWRYVIASGWRRIDDELPLMGRAGHRGDDLGSRVIASRLVDTAIHLAFTVCRRWAPYPKWRGTLLSTLPVVDEFGGALAETLAASDWEERTRAMSVALDQLCELQRDVGLPAVDRACVPFWERPYMQIDQQLVPGLTDSIDDPVIRGLPIGLGSIDQRTTNVNLLVNADRRRLAVRSGTQTLRGPAST